MSAQEVKTVKQRKDGGFDTRELKELDQGEEHGEFIETQAVFWQFSKKMISAPFLPSLLDNSHSHVLRLGRLSSARGTFLGW